MYSFIQKTLSLQVSHHTPRHMSRVLQNIMNRFGGIEYGVYTGFLVRKKRFRFPASMVAICACTHTHAWRLTLCVFVWVLLDENWGVTIYVLYMCALKSGWLG